MYYSDLSDF